MRTLIPLVAVLLIGACSTLPPEVKRQARGPNIAEVLADLPDLELEPAKPYKPTRAEVMAAYNRVYGQLSSPTENHAIGKRLADLEMGVGEDRDIDGMPNPYDEAIARYEGLLQAPEGVPLDQILYQLARAYDLSRQPARSMNMLNRLIGEYPESAYISEAHFRRAEMHFSADRFSSAAEDYAYVVGQGDQTPYLKNARYMLGWSEFKQSNLEEGLTSFFEVVDDVMSAEDPLPQTERELLDDSFRAIVLALQYLDGPQTLAERMRVLERPHWQHLAYEKLADDYLTKERFLDSVRTLQAFVEHNELDPLAPKAYERMVKTLIDADFPSEVGPHKEQFVARFGVASEFFAVHDDAVKATYLQTLHSYITDLSKAAHALAQEKAEGGEEDPTNDYLRAAQWYEEFLLTFPQDEAVAERLFLLGEVYTEASEPMLAVAAYQRVVREHAQSFEQAHEAGYAAILGLGKALELAPEDEKEIVQLLQIDAQLEFALLFSGDPRAPSVQAAAADSLFALAHYQQAVDVASNLLTTWATAEEPVRRSALLIVGHGQFELEAFVQAEAAYRALLDMVLPETERAPVQERLLATVFKQGEKAEAEERTEDAVAHYLRIADLDSTSELAVRGHFDAIAVVESTGDQAEAARLLESMRSRYPDHELSQDVGLRLAGLYEETESWEFAARELSVLAERSEDLQMRRQSRYRAAELYLKVGNRGAAINQFVSYVEEHPEPAEIRFEAMQQLDEIYVALEDETQRRVWMANKIALHKQLGKSATERMTYVAAHDRFFLAQDDRRAFEAVALTHPLRKSLKLKQKALKKSVASFEEVAEYQVAELATAATFHIADLYTKLGRSIMQSDRPDNLSEMELEQYEILLEEQAYPFEEQAISLHEINMRRSWEGTYDDWVKRSFEELGRLMPSRFDKQEIEVAYVEVIH